jgi:4'-phosphopantetheinyl transferase EntD
MIEHLLPPYVACVECKGDDPTAELLPAEAAQLGRAVEKRVREYATARTCARRALAALGAAPQALLKGPHREPLWPAGYIGSITHCEGYRGAAVARCREAATLGIDAELHEPLPAGVLAMVTLPAEREWLERAPSGIHWDRLIFSAKESLYKAWFPLTHEWLDFRDACVGICPADGTFHVRLLVPPPRAFARVGTDLTGYFLVTGCHLLTAIAVDQ